MCNWYASFFFCAEAPPEPGRRHAHSATAWMVARAASRDRILGLLSAAFIVGRFRFDSAGAAQAGSRWSPSEHIARRGRTPRDAARQGGRGVEPVFSRLEIRGRNVFAT
jgi:hypothetical protein